MILLSPTGGECRTERSGAVLIVVSVRAGSITVKGHAGYADPGRDIVCAGVTALVQTLVKSLENFTRDRIQYDISPGRADIYYGDLSGKGKTLVDSFFLGISLIAEEFPEYVKII